MQLAVHRFFGLLSSNTSCQKTNDRKHLSVWNVGIDEWYISRRGRIFWFQIQQNAASDEVVNIVGNDSAIMSMIPNTLIGNIRNIGSVGNNHINQGAQMSSTNIFGNANQLGSSVFMKDNTCYSHFGSGGRVRKKRNFIGSTLTCFSWSRLETVRIAKTRTVDPEDSHYPFHRRQKTTRSSLRQLTDRIFRTTPSRSRSPKLIFKAV